MLDRNDILEVVKFTDVSVGTFTIFSFPRPWRTGEQVLLFTPNLLADDAKEAFDRARPRWSIRRLLQHCRPVVLPLDEASNSAVLSGRCDGRYRRIPLKKSGLK